MVNESTDSPMNPNESYKSFIGESQIFDIFFYHRLTLTKGSVSLFVPKMSFIGLFASQISQGSGKMPVFGFEGLHEKPKPSVRVISILLVITQEYIIMIHE